MAFFGVTREQIASVNPVPNADSLDVATLTGMDFPFVVRRGDWKVGDPAIYFPVDSVLPMLVQEKLGLVGKLAGSNKDRVKTVRLRGQYSMGVVAKPELFEIPDGADITVTLGVSKYEPPVVPCKSGTLAPLPPGISKYDIEGADRYADIFRTMLDYPVVVMEKMEGQNVSFTLDVVEKKFYVNQRNYTIYPAVEGDLHDLWKYAVENDIENKLDEMVRQLSFTKVNRTITLYGEYVGPGVQGNIYKFPKNFVLFFDIKIDDKFVNFDSFRFMIDKAGLGNDVVPIISEGKTLRSVLNGKTTQEYAHGKSLRNTQVLREGVVYKPMVETTHEKIGRLILKTRDPIYLEKTGY